MAKTLYIIAGCNGAGKTTASMLLLPEILDCPEFVNADEIARGLSPFHPEEVAIQAGKLMLERIGVLVKGDKSFAIETTLSTKSYQFLVKEAHDNGFKVQLMFFWLPTPQQAIERVAARVSEGGHDIPEDVILRRYHSGIDNLFNIYMNIVDSWVVAENYHTPRTIVAEGDLKGPDKVYSEELFQKLKSYVRRREGKII